MQNVGALLLEMTKGVRQGDTVHSVKESITGLAHGG